MPRLRRWKRSPREFCQTLHPFLMQRFSYAFILLTLVLTGWFHLGALLLSVLFSYFIITKLNFLKPRARWLAVVIFVLILAVLAFALADLIHRTIRALPKIADAALPAITKWAAENK